MFLFDFRRAKKLLLKFKIKNIDFKRNSFKMAKIGSRQAMAMAEAMAMASWFLAVQQKKQ